MKDFPPFLTTREDGAIVLAGHRIGLEHIVACFDDGYSPEMIVEEFPSLPLSLVYRVIAYYLDNRAETTAYCGEADKKFDETIVAAKPVDVAALRQRLGQKRALEAVEWTS